MTVGGRQVLVRRRWLALLSIVWMAAVYVAWMVLRSPDAAPLLAHAQAQCEAFGRSYEYAECMQFASEVMNSRQADVARAATLIAILPIGLLWTLWAAGRLLRECRAVGCSETERAA